MTIPTRHHQSLSSVIRDAADAVLNDPEHNHHRIFAATRIQELLGTKIVFLEMRSTWAFIQSRTYSTGKPTLEIQPLRSPFGFHLIDPDGEPTPFMRLMTDPKHVFGGETIVYEPGYEPCLTLDDKTPAAVRARLLEPPKAKIVQPVELTLLDYDSALVLDGPEEFFLPDAQSIASRPHHFTAYQDFLPWTALQYNNDANPESDDNDTYSTILEITNDPNTSAPKVTLVPTVWYHRTIGLDFQVAWREQLGSVIDARIGPFQIEHSLSKGDQLETVIMY